MESTMKRARTAVKEDEISIYVRVTKTIKLNVKESDSIENVKALVHDKEGIPVCHQQLFLEDNRLMDGQTLVDYGVHENSILDAFVQDSAPVVKLLVKRSFAQGIITFHSKIYDTIKDVISGVMAKEGIYSGKFGLFHDGKFLEDNKTLAFLDIEDGSTFHMVLNPSDKFLIAVVMPNYQIERIEVMATLSVRDVKAVIASKVGRSIDGMPLFMRKQKLEDEKALYHYDITEGSVLLVVEGMMQIFISKGTNGERATLEVHKHNLIKEVKGMILDKLGIPVHLQKLMFKGIRLADPRYLSSYKIHNESTLYLDISNYSENLTHSNPQTELLCDDSQPQRQMNSVTGSSNSVMNHSDDVRNSRANTGGQRKSNRVNVLPKKLTDYDVKLDDRK